MQRQHLEAETPLHMNSTASDGILSRSWGWASHHRGLLVRLGRDR